MKELLGACPADLRGWEWHRLYFISDRSIQTISSHSDAVTSVAFSADGNLLASGSRDHMIKLWDADMPPDVLMLCVDPQGVNVQDEKIHAIDFSPDGRHIVSASGPAMGKSPKDNTVRIWDAVTGETLKVLRDHTDTVEAVTYSPKGDRIVSGSRDGTVRLGILRPARCSGISQDTPIASLP